MVAIACLNSEVVRAVLLDDDGEAVEVLDAGFELGSIHQPNAYGQPIAPRQVEERILDIRDHCRLGIKRLRHATRLHSPGERAGEDRRVRPRRARRGRCVPVSSPKFGIHTRLGSLRNQINWRRAYCRFSRAMSSRVSASSRTPASSSRTRRYTYPENGRAVTGTPDASRPRTSSTMPRSNCKATRAGDALGDGGPRGTQGQTDDGPSRQRRARLGEVRRERATGLVVHLEGPDDAHLVLHLDTRRRRADRCAATDRGAGRRRIAPPSGPGAPAGRHPGRPREQPTGEGSVVEARPANENRHTAAIRDVGDHCRRVAGVVGGGVLEVRRHHIHEMVRDPRCSSRGTLSVPMSNPR